MARSNPDTRAYPTDRASADGWRPRGTARPADPALHRDPSVQNLLPTYLREMGRTPLIDRGEETRLARRMHDARVEFAGNAASMPPRFLARMAAAGTTLPDGTEEWPLDDLERFWQAARAYGDVETDACTVAALTTLARAKRRLDVAREALILANLRLVVFLAKRSARSGISLMDLIQDGNLGLMKAVEKFDFERGNKFSTYAYWWIKQAIDRGIAEKGRMIRIPVHLTEKRKKMFRAVADLRRELGRPPTHGEIARAMRVPVERVDELMSIVAEPQGFGDLTSDEAAEMLQHIPDTTSVDPLEHAEEHELHRRIDLELGRLEPRQEEIIRLRFGIGREGGHTLEEIGRKVDLSRERVRQLETIALRKLQGSELLGEYLAARRA